jgi:hypothetical protein
MRSLAVLIACVGIVSLAHGGGMADVEVYDRTSHRILPIYEHQGRLYVAGEPRHQYELRLRNQASTRVLAVTSVDGVNVVSGKTAAEHQGGYVIDRWASVTIDGWRKSLDEVATFYFTTLNDSYAARTGRPRNVGVIGVALFSERTPCCAHFRDRLATPSEPASATAESAGQAADSASESERSVTRRESKLGTGHGHREPSPAEYVDFQRASDTPDETIVIYYDSHQNLVAQGVLPKRDRFADRLPEPFPDGFVPDP